MIKVKRFLFLKFDAKLSILEKIYTTNNSDKITKASSINPLVKTFITLANRIIIVDKDRDQNRANLVRKLEDTAPKIFNTK